MPHVESHVVEDLLPLPLSKQAPTVLVSAVHMAEGQHQFSTHGSASFRFLVGMAAMSRWL